MVLCTPPTFLTNYQYLDVIFDTPHITNITVKNQMHIRFDTILQLGMAVPNYIKRDINASIYYNTYLHI